MNAVVSFTITTEDDNLAKKLEPNAPPPTKRIHAIKQLTQERIPVCARIDPIIPHINDNPEKLIKTLAALNVKHITASTYKAKPDNWNRLKQALPETARKLEPLYSTKGERIGGYQYLPKELRYTLMKNIKKLTEATGMTFGTCREGFPKLNTFTCDGAEYCGHSH
jgi:DNA repair photolyase